MGWVETMSADTAAVRTEELLAHADWVRGLARRLVADAGVADDLVQETWLEALRRPPGDRRNLRGWLARVVRRRARQRARSEGRRARREGAAEAGEAPPAAEELAERFELQRLLARFVAELREPYREAVLLRYYEGHAAAEIARHLGVPAGTVRWRLKQALDELRDRLDESTGGDRRAWCAALAPLASLEAGRGLGGAGASLLLLLQGALTVKILALLAAAAAVLLSLWAGLSATGVLDGSRSDAPRGAEVATAPEPGVEPEAAPAEPDGDRGETRAAVEPEPAREPGAAAAEPPPEAPLPEASVGLRVLDEAGVALAGARVRRAGPRGEETATDSGGRAELVLRFNPALRTAVTEGIRISLAGHASATLELEIAPGERKALGDVVLAPGGAVAGRVVDAAGQPVAGAGVELVGVELGRSLRQQRLLQTMMAEGLPPGEVATGEDGTFRIDGVPVGYARLCAVADGYLASFSEPFEVRARQESSGVAITMDRLEDRDVIEGVVLDPAGRPVPFASLQYESRTKWGSSSGSSSTGADGRFRWILLDRGTRDVWARDGQDRWGAVFAPGIEPGTRDLVLQLGEARTVAVVATAPGGEPVRELQLTALDAEGRRAFQTTGTVESEEGRASIQVPGSAFVLSVDAVGYAVAQLGPFEPEAVPERLAVELTPLPGVRGRVLSGGEPLPGARVSLVPEVRHAFEHNGLPVHVDPLNALETTADAEGRFVLSLREAGEYRIHAEADGRALLELGPLELNPTEGLTDLELELTAGGALEGWVRSAPDRSPEGTVVCVNRGDGKARSLRADESGYYRIEQLTPGPWQVLVLEEELPRSGGGSTWSSGKPRLEIPADCWVHEGAVTRHDIDLEGASGCVLEGRFTFDGSAPGPWQASLSPVETPLFDRPGIPPTRLDAAGTFRLTAAQPGGYRLQLAGDSGLEVPLQLLAELELAPGPNPFELDLATGSIRIENAPAASPGGVEPVYVLVWQRDGVRALLPLGSEEGGDLTVPRFPAGSVRVARLDPQAIPPGPVDPSRWPTVGQIEVPAGGEVSFRIP